MTYFIVREYQRVLVEYLVRAPDKVLAIAKAKQIDQDVCEISNGPVYKSTLDYSAIAAKESDFEDASLTKARTLIELNYEDEEDKPAVKKRLAKKKGPVITTSEYKPTLAEQLLKEAEDGKAKTRG